MGLSQSIDNITPSNHINNVLNDNDELKQKYYKIKTERKSYKNRIIILEKKIAKLTNQITELEINSRELYKINKRGSGTSNYLHNRIKNIEKKLDNSILLESPKNNIPFCVKKI
jgi:uncharacterized coiled-coil DUF342 family protein